METSVTYIGSRPFQVAMGDTKLELGGILERRGRTLDCKEVNLENEIFLIDSSITSYALNFFHDIEVVVCYEAHDSTLTTFPSFGTSFVRW